MRIVLRKGTGVRTLERRREVYKSAVTRVPRSRQWEAMVVGLLLGLLQM